MDGIPMRTSLAEKEPERPSLQLQVCRRCKLVQLRGGPKHLAYSTIPKECHEIHAMSCRASRT